MLSPLGRILITSLRLLGDVLSGRPLYVYGD